MTLKKYQFRNWMLSLDKYIDPKSNSKKRYFSLLLGVFLCPIVVFISMILLRLSYDLAILILIIPVIIAPFFIKINAYTWLNDRFTQQVIVEKKSFDCGCNPQNLPELNESGWLIYRLVEHYTCTGYPIISGLLIGCQIGSIALWLLYLTCDFRII